MPKAWGRGAIAGLAVALLAGCSPFRVIDALVPASGYQETSDIAYGPDPRQRLDVYAPAAAAPGISRPVIVFFYGGSWAHGSRDDYRFVAQALTSRDMVVVIPDYRLYPQVTYPDFLEDSARAVAWAYRHAREHGGDPAQLYLMGHSAGAYNAAMLALDERWLAAQSLAPSQLAGWIGLAGPYDFLPASGATTRAIFHDPDYPAGAQPIEHVGGHAPRTFLGAAQNDSVVDPERNTRALAAGLAAAGVPLELKVYARVNHATVAAALASPLRWLAPVLDDVSAFVQSDRSLTTVR